MWWRVRGRLPNSGGECAGVETDALVHSEQA
eukprot:CAMPEP_0177284894 /NCGR_PEP_ID=MMETSP0367-20130122/72773_1 /TAXON_ID=447022 ORGANISM="Scrippsiella hangoei-like, Strain SHHI-4" /NCGR_SAMPLE_ID=MMETSP0367 /ASSEMBLY_ACC=CAM_ASM_000362 /LENGTH=30 /DNA_ID= /DNA_START= /DNA_END= /DNA_ORIENTATION=